MAEEKVQEKLMKRSVQKLFSQSEIEKAQDLCLGKFMILMPWHNHVRGPFASEDEAFDWLKRVGWSRSGVTILQVTHPNCSTMA